MQVIGQIFVRMVVSIIFSFLLALILGLVYYHFKWLDHDEEDRPEFDALDFGVKSQVSFFIIGEKLLPSKAFYILVTLLTVILFIVFLQ